MKRVLKASKHGTQAAQGGHCIVGRYHRAKSQDKCERHKLCFKAKKSCNLCSPAGWLTGLRWWRQRGDAAGVDLFPNTLKAGRLVWIIFPNNPEKEKYIRERCAGVDVSCPEISHRPQAGQSVPTTKSLLCCLLDIFCWTSFFEIICFYWTIFWISNVPNPVILYTQMCRIADLWQIRMKYDVFWRERFKCSCKVSITGHKRNNFVALSLSLFLCIKFTLRSAYRNNWPW